MCKDGIRDGFVAKVECAEIWKGHLSQCPMSWEFSVDFGLILYYNNGFQHLQWHIFYAKLGLKSGLRPQDLKSLRATWAGTHTLTKISFQY